MAVLVSISVFIVVLFTNNLIVKTKELHYSLQTLCMVNPMKLVLDSLLLVMYGFGRCAERDISIPLYLFDINDQDFYTNIHILIIQFVILRLVPMLTLLLKVNHSVINTNKTFKTIEKKQLILLRKIINYLSKVTFCYQ